MSVWTWLAWLSWEVTTRMVAPAHGFHLPGWTPWKKPLENEEVPGLVWWARQVLHGTMTLGHLPLCISGSLGLQQVHRLLAHLVQNQRCAEPSFCALGADDKNLTEMSPKSFRTWGGWFPAPKGCPDVGRNAGQVCAATVPRTLLPALHSAFTGFQKPFLTRSESDVNWNHIVR